MVQQEFQKLAGAVEAADPLGTELAARALAALRTAFPVQAAEGLIPEGDLSTDALLALVQAALPGWHYKIHGRARPSGAWSCSLRRSDVLDDDEILGTGDADSLSQALLAAILRIVALR